MDEGRMKGRMVNIIYIPIIDWIERRTQSVENGGVTTSH